MSTLFRQTRAMQFSAVSLVITAAITALPLLAADQFDDAYYTNQIVQVFQKIGASSTAGIYNNGSMETSAFDFASFFSHTCYRPTEFDMPGCKEKFGPYANLKQTYDSGKLGMIFSGVPYLKDLAKIVPGNYGHAPSSSASSVSSSPVNSSASSAPASSVSSSVSSSASSFDLMDRKDRASQVWALCVKKFPERNESVGCYQRNIRLIMERMEAVDDHLVY
ncbi:MAG: hypothetical protein KBC47_01800 [Candidatus Peribacteraceae bacterium]|nr:hypothetical protein [Candidatus Peribacteraceae bacterium]